MGLDEQREEREVLDSIFSDEITGRRVHHDTTTGTTTDRSHSDISETEYRVSITLDVTNEDDDDTPARARCFLNSSKT